MWEVVATGAFDDWFAELGEDAGRQSVRKATETVNGDYNGEVF